MADVTKKSTMNFNIANLIKFYLLVSYAKVSISIEDEPGLYKRSDPMVLLNNATVMENLVGNDKAWIVEFYSSWCGHCQAFAPKWIRLAWELKNWERYLHVGVIDCAQEKNYPNCRGFKIESYPTIKFFDVNWRNDTGSPNALGKTYKGDKDLFNMRKAAVDHIESQSNPNFDKSDIPFQFIGEEEVSSFSTNTMHRYLALVFESPGSYIGKLLIMDTSKCKTLSVRRVSSENDNMISKYGLLEFPALILITTTDGTWKELSQDNRTHIGFIHALNQISGDIIPKKPTNIKELEKENKKLLDGIELEKLKNMTSEIHMADILSGVSFALRREIPKKEIINGKDIVALRDFVDLMYQCLPAEQHLRNFLTQLNDWVHLSENKIALSSTKYLNYLSSRQEWDSYIPIQIDWKGCKGSQPKYRGFPCSLWTMFHIMTVNCKLVSPHTQLTGFNIINRIRKFIDSFFGCRHCRDHFMKMSDNIAGEVFSIEDAALWLWKGHNRVNARLQEDVSTDPLFPKVQFPPDHLCPECRKPTAPENTIVTDPGFGIGLIKWNRGVVLEFLKEHYGPDNIRIRERTPESRSIEENISTDAVRRRFSYIFYPRTASPGSFAVVGMSRVDTYLCVLLYGGILVTVIGLYLHFIRKRRRKLWKSYV